MQINFNITMPKKQFKAGGYIDAIAEVMKSKTAPELRVLFLKTVFGWSGETKPTFSRELTRRTYRISMRVYASDNAEIYTLVSKGSPRHTYGPRNATALRFRTGYRQATTPGNIQSRRAYKSGPYVTRMSVNHPGFQDRSFDSLIANEYEPTFVSDMQEVMNNVAREP